MILDVGLHGVTIWHENNVTNIRGKDVYNTCVDIYYRVVRPKEIVNGKIIYEQIYDLYIDVTGISRAYIDCLLHFGLKVHEITYKKIDDILPKCISFNPRIN